MQTELRLHSGMQGRMYNCMIGNQSVLKDLDLTMNVDRKVATSLSRVPRETYD